MVRKLKFDPNKNYCMCNNKDCCVSEYGCSRTDDRYPGEKFCNFEMGREENRFCGDCKDKNAMLKGELK
jgi:hypothetical protein